MQNMNNALRLSTFISQLEAGRSEQVAAMVVEAALPYGTSMTTGPAEAAARSGSCPGRSPRRPTRSVA
jgi:hypothetical protein